MTDRRVWLRTAISHAPQPGALSASWFSSLTLSLQHQQCSDVVHVRQYRVIVQVRVNPHCAAAHNTLSTRTSTPHAGVHWGVLACSVPTHGSLRLTGVRSQERLRLSNACAATCRPASNLHALHGPASCQHPAAAPHCRHAASRRLARSLTEESYSCTFEQEYSLSVPQR